MLSGYGNGCSDRIFVELQSQFEGGGEEFRKFAQNRKNVIFPMLIFSAQGRAWIAVRLARTRSTLKHSAEVHANPLRHRSTAHTGSKVVEKKVQKRVRNFAVSSVLIYYMTFSEILKIL